MAEGGGLDAEALLANFAAERGPDLGDLGGLARELGLSRAEREALAMAYAYEARVPCAEPGGGRPAVVGDELRGCAEHR